MKLIQLTAITGTALILFACGFDDNRLTVINSESFPEKQITIDVSLMQRISDDSVLTDQSISMQEKNILPEKIDEIISITRIVRETRSDSTWTALLASWEDFRNNHVGADGVPFSQPDIISDSLLSFESLLVARKWAELNINLLKMSGEIRFGDVLEKLLYEPKVPVLSEKLLKSVIYTHIDDQIFINLIGSSSLNHFHTTGGIVKLIQETDFPLNNEMTLTCECNDVRYLDVFIRIPEWAVNPTVTHGNVKYVPHAGEYCQISRKWKNGDEIQVRLKN